jgi:delta 1-pyrroline-5-carboxylate dehydrogenase
VAKRVFASCSKSISRLAESEDVRESHIRIPGNAEAPITECMLIDGKPVDGVDRIEVRNPAGPEELVGTIVRGTPAHVDQAVPAAKARQSAWAALTSRSAPTS